MRVSIIKSDGAVCVDGICIINLDLSWLPENFHALQWYGDFGNLETVDGTPPRPQNTNIDSFAPYQRAVDMWQQAKADSEAGL